MQVQTPTSNTSVRRLPDLVMDFRLSPDQIRGLMKIMRGPGDIAAPSTWKYAFRYHDNAPVGLIISVSRKPMELNVIHSAETPESKAAQPKQPWYKRLFSGLKDGVVNIPD